MWVEGMHIHHRHATLRDRFVPFGTSQRINLHATAAITFNTVASTADQQDMLGIGRAFARHVHGQFFAIATFVGVDVGFNLKTNLCSCCQKLLACLCIALRKCVVNVCHESSK